MTSPADIGPTLVATRLARGMTQRRLAEELGVRQPQIARWEASAYRSASLGRVDAVARVLGVDLSQPGWLAAEPVATYDAAAWAGAGTDTGARALARLGVSPETIDAFCRLHGVRAMALFGSSVRTDFGPDSDVDVLVTWGEGCRPADLAELEDVRTELAGIFRRAVDLVERATIERSDNYIRKARILDGAWSVYVAR